MAGLLRAPAAATLVTALRSNFDLPVHVHTHDTPGGQLATYLAAWQAGADAVDGASAAMAGTTSQPALSAIVAAAAHTERDTGLNLANVCDLEPYWEALRKVYAPFESGLPAPTGRVYTHEIPGGQLSNLRQQAIALGLGDRFEDIEKAYADADRLLGRLIKVTPSSKVVGDLALHLVGAGVCVDEFAADPGRFDIPDSVVGFLRGDLGTPADGWPEPLREKAVAGRDTPTAVVELSVQDEKALGGDPEVCKSTLNRLLFPGPTKDFLAHREQFGDTSGLSANQFFYGLRQGDEHRVTLEKGVELVIGLEAISEPDEAGMRTVMCILNGQLRPVSVRDRSVAPQAPAAEKADRNDPSQVAAPFSGVVTLTVDEGDSIVAAQPIATIEAMKIEASITAPRTGTITRLAINTVQQVEGGDLLAVISVGDYQRLNLNSRYDWVPVSGQAKAFRPRDRFVGATTLRPVEHGPAPGSLGWRRCRPATVGGPASVRKMLASSTASVASDFAPDTAWSRFIGGVLLGIAGGTLIFAQALLRSSATRATSRTPE